MTVNDNSRLSGPPGRAGDPGQGTGTVSGMMNALEQAVPQTQAFPRIRLAEARAEYHAGRLPQATSLLDETIAILDSTTGYRFGMRSSPGDQGIILASALSLLARIASEKGDDAGMRDLCLRAARLFDQWLGVTKPTGQEYTDYAWTLLTLGQDDQATEMLERALKESDSPAEAYRLSGELHLKKGYPARAEHDLTIAVVLDPSDFRSSIAVARAIEAQGGERAEDISDHYTQAAAAAAALGDMESALAAVRSALTATPQRPDLLQAEAGILYTLGRYR